MFDADGRGRPGTAEVERREGAEIVFYEDGPYLLRGTFVVRDNEGRELPVTRRTVALCRCGKSRIRPLCDGTHRTIKFRAPGTPERWPEPDRGGPDVEASESTVGIQSPSRSEEVLQWVDRAHRCLTESLMTPCVPVEYPSMRLAEPLIGAARSLLVWQAGLLGELDSSTTGDLGPDRGAEASRALVIEALRHAMRLPRSSAEGGTDHIRSLLRDAAVALRPSGAPSGQRL
ncbi:MAG TPA: CDGSH iron-sulfur domain-containing protein [Solirubrobacteraceae bacterium]|nr:CDGSH iron-sulfur domain-containing protein [Solirubrobacteraceae bacterium]